MTESILFDSWMGLLRVLVVGLAAYVILLVFLRLSGKRTLSKMNAFDFIVTIALGSTLSAVLLDETVPLAEGVLGLAMLVFLQYAITWLSVRSSFIVQLVKAEPTLLAKNGQLLHRAMRDQRITRDEVEAAIRQQGKQSVEEVELVILETDGSMSVIASNEPRNRARYS